LLRSAITESLALRTAITEPLTLFLLTVSEQSFAVSELRACLLSLPNDAVIALTESLALRCAITEPRALSLLRPAITESLALRAAITEPLTLFLLTVAEQSFAVSELRACLLSLPNDAVVALTESLALRGAISEPRSLSLLRSAISESLAPRAVIIEPKLLLLTVAEQSFAVSELRACLLSLPNDPVITLLSFPDTASELQMFVCPTGSI